MSDLSAKIAAAVASVRARTDANADIGLVLGSGMGGLAERIDGVRIPYADIDGFPVSTAPGHDGHLCIGTLGGRMVVAMQGRVHLYEGYSPAEVAFPVMVLAALGVRTLIVTNAAGGLNADYATGDLVVIEDHLSLPNLAGLDPLRGHNDPTLGPRFLSMNKAYSADLIATTQRAAQTLGIVSHSGVYGFVVGPTLETPAEVRALRSFGCDVVGMSTVPEVIAARYCGLDVLAISAVCNQAVDSVDDTHVTSAAEVYAVVEAVTPKLQSLLLAVIAKI